MSKQPETLGGEAGRLLPAAPGSAFLTWFNQSQWAGAGKDAGELAQAAWNAAILEASEIYWHHKITIRKTGIGDSQIMVAAIKNAAHTPNDKLTP